MKIIIVGNGGTGKSTVGDQLGKSLSLPVTHLDTLSWDKNWKRREEKEFTQELKEVLSGKEWIVEGWSFHSTMIMRIKAADHIFYLNYPLWFCYWNALKRHLKYTFRQNPYDPPGAWIWSKTAKMIKAMWLVHKKYQPELERWLIEYGNDKSIHEFHSRRDLKIFLRKFVNEHRI
jgi:hypothetical protein